MHDIFVIARRSRMAMPGASLTDNIMPCGYNAEIAGAVFIVISAMLYKHYITDYIH